MKRTKFHAQNKDEARRWIEMKVAEGAKLHSPMEWYLENGLYYFITENDEIWSIPNYLFDLKHLPIDTLPPLFLTPDFSELKVGDKVKCVVYGDGVVKKIDIEDDHSIEVEFVINMYGSYTMDGCFILETNPTLFYPFSGQFPTAEACVRPKQAEEGSGRNSDTNGLVAFDVSTMADSQRIDDVQKIKISEPNIFHIDHKGHKVEISDVIKVDGQEVFKFPVDPYKLHGVTREEVAKIAEAVELVRGWHPQMITFDKFGVCRALNVITYPIDGFWNINGVKDVQRVTKLNRPSPYEHWETPIILGGE